MVSFDSLLKGLLKLKLDEKAILADVNSHWEVTAEAIQTVTSLPHPPLLPLRPLISLLYMLLWDPQGLTRKPFFLQILRREAVDGAYELLKEETRGETVTEQSIGNFVKKLETHPTIKLSPGECCLRAKLTWLPFDEQNRTEQSRIEHNITLTLRKPPSYQLVGKEKYLRACYFAQHFDGAPLWAPLPPPLSSPSSAPGTIANSKPPDNKFPLPDVLFKASKQPPCPSPIPRGHRRARRNYPVQLHWILRARD